MSSQTAILPEFIDETSAKPEQALTYQLFIPSATRLPYIFLRHGKRMVLGRGNSSILEQPDIDLSLYGAREKGVSRIHAAIEFCEDRICIVDLSSLNGTYLNGQHLVPHQRYEIQDRDEMRFGNFVVYLIFL